MVAGSKKDKINGDALGTGRRKSSVARVRVRAGSGKIVINKKDLADFFPNLKDQINAKQPLDASGRSADVDVIVRVHGGGTTGQSVRSAWESLELLSVSTKKSSAACVMAAS